MTEGMIQGHRRISGPTETPDGFPLPLTVISSRINGHEIGTLENNRWAERCFRGGWAEMGESAIVFRLRWWIESYEDTRRMFDRVHTTVHKALEAAGIEIPYTTYDVNLNLNGNEVEAIAETA